MSELAQLDETMTLTDLGDVTVETKQQLPWPPYYADAAFGSGTKPSYFE
jgi:hypothetical protein